MRSWQEQVDRILEEIQKLFEIEREKTETGKNLELVHIFLPQEEFNLLEKSFEFKVLHNLGGIPCSLSRDGRLRIDTETVNPRKRKRKTVIYVK